MPIKKIMKWGVLVFAVSTAGFIAFSYYLNARKKDCLEGEGRKAVEACTFLISRHTAGYKAEYLLRRARLSEKAESWDEVLADLNELLAIKVAAQVPPEQVLAAYEGWSKRIPKKGTPRKCRNTSSSPRRAEAKSRGSIFPWPGLI